MQLIKENDKAQLWQLPGGSFEIWMKLFYPGGAKKGQQIEPTDESFGVTAWQSYSLGRANEVFNLITEGKRMITPMTESTTE